MIDLSKLSEAVCHEQGVSRRLFLAYAASLSAIPLMGKRATAAAGRESFSSNPFRLGVASGDPAPQGAVLWTRLAPNPLEPGGGLEPRDINVSWEVASDEAMRKVVSRGTAVATPKLGHSVHVEVDNLAPDRWYWYRFRCGDAESPIGRTRTMPSADSTPEELRFAFASCQHYESGLYTAYEHMAQEDIDLVLHLGDYIYEGKGEDGRVRKHLGKELQSLEDYRLRHAQYKTDELLQTMHALCPWVVTWDDHEFDNDYANNVSEIKGEDPAKFLMRRAAAYQAYYEMMPLRSTSLPRGPKMSLYRKMSFGQLAEFFVLDGRQYRSDQPNGGEDFDIRENSRSSDCSMLGAQQFEWLQDSLSNSRAGWNVMAQQVLLGLIDRAPGEKRRYPMDTWCGYTCERERLLTFLGERRVANPVVLTGDCHSNWVNDLRADDPTSEAAIVATEFAGTSISSGGNGEQHLKLAESLRAENHGVQYFNGERGYVRCTVTPDEWRTDFRVAEYIDRPGAPVKTRASFALESGQTGANGI